MTAHLPECPVVTYTKVIDAVLVLPGTDLSTTNLGKTVTVTEGECICQRLRACEQRMYDWSKSFGVGKTFYDAGRADGLEAAREAVGLLASDMANWSSAETAAATDATPDLTVDQWLWAQRGVHRALAAIDALEEKP